MTAWTISPYRAGLVFSAARLLTSSFSFVYLLGVGLSVSDVSTTRMIQLIALVALEVPCGTLADRIGPRRALLTATLVSALWLGTMAVVSDLPTLIVAELLNALSLSLFSGAFEVLLRDTHQAKNPIANFGKAQALWIAGASLLGALFATVVSRQAAWALAALIQAGLLALLWRDLRRHRPVPATASAPRTAAGSGALRTALRTIRALPISFLITFTAPTLVFDVVLQFWQPIVALVGVPADNNLVLVLISLAIMVAMSAGSGAEEMTGRRWLIPAAVVSVPVTAGGILLTEGDIRIVWTLIPIVLLTGASTALRSRAVFQLTQAVRGDAEVAAFSGVSALARVVSGLVIVGVGALLTSAANVAVVMLVLTALISTCFLASRVADRATVAHVPGTRRNDLILEDR